MSFNIWEGIYEYFTECPKNGEGFSSARWVEQQVQRINDLRTQISKVKEEIVGYQTSLLPLVTAMSGKDKVKILDFGGGLGNTYLLMSSGCIKEVEFDFFIVEAEELCAKGRELFRDNGNIHFYSELPKDIKSFDIIHLGSSIQYIEDWKAIMKDFAKYKPDYILFADVPAGQIPTYATLQNYYGSKMPHWFFNIDEFLKSLDSVNYSLIFKSAFIGPRLGIIQPMPQDNFLKEYRLGETCNLLFSRKNI